MWLRPGTKAMMRIVRWFVAVGVVAALAGCAGDRPSQSGSPGTGTGYKVGNPYQIGGIWYTPVEDYDYEEVGIASWYGSEFDGRRTANGEVFDKDKVSAAHRTLPMPSVVEVTNLENGRTLVVRVNDRGPFARGRIIDMSERAAELLGFAEQGTAQVRVRVLPDESMALKMQALGTGGATQAASLPPAAPIAVDSEDLSPPGQAAEGAPAAGSGPTIVASGPDNGTAASEPGEPDAAPPPPAVSVDGSVFVQAGSFREEGNASRMSDALREFGPTRVVAADISGERYYRVQLGPFETVDTGTQMVWTLRDAGISGARVVSQ